jgi:hypothetical protein
MLGFGAVLAAGHDYPPLDSGPIFIGAILLFFGSFFLHVSAALHKGMAQYFGVVTFLTAGAVILLLLVSAAVFGNGGTGPPTGDDDGHSGGWQRWVIPTLTLGHVLFAGEILAARANRRAAGRRRIGLSRGTDRFAGARGSASWIPGNAVV